MRLTTSLLDQLSNKYTGLLIKESSDFAWNPDTHSVCYDKTHPNSLELLLHELSHGILNHRDYKRDIELLAMEASAWDKALELAREFNLAIDDQIIQDHLDTYRDWMHARSTCPKCSANGLQKNDHYECVACGHAWRSNEARLCGLKRYSIKIK